MIREATIEDLKEIVRLGKSFFDDALYYLDIEYNPIDVWKTLDVLRKDDNGILLVAEVDGKIVGMIAGAISTWYFNIQYKFGQEIFWYMSPAYRGTILGIKLLKELEKQAKSKGCSKWCMISEYHMGNSEELDKLYKRCGYINHETSYIKDL